MSPYRQDVYVPGDESSNGIMVFLHGAGGSAAVKSDYQVASNADVYGFIGVVPDGSQSDGDDGKGDDYDSYFWNVDDTDGVDEVRTVLDVGCLAELTAYRVLV